MSIKTHATVEAYVSAVAIGLCLTVRHTMHSPCGIAA